MIAARLRPSLFILPLLAPRCPRGAFALVCLLAGGITFLATGCATTPPPRTFDHAPTDDALEIDRLARAMTGTFSSSMQASLDPAFRAVVLHMVPILHLEDEAEDDRWLYIEQAMADAPQRPYRQRVYRLRAIDGVDGARFESSVFELGDDPLRFAGAWNDARRLAAIDRNALIRRDGCEVILEAIVEPDGSRRWLGATIDARCLSTLFGATYATSEVEITETLIRTWDRGYDAEGIQVWGSTAGAYEFRRE